MNKQKNESGMNKKEKVDFLKGLLTGVRSIREIAPGKTFYLKPDEHDPKTFHIVTLGNRTGKKISITELPKYPISKKDWVILLAPYDRYGFDIASKCMTVVTSNPKTAEQLLDISAQHTEITKDGDIIKPPSWFDGSPL